MLTVKNISKSLTIEKKKIHILNQVSFHVKAEEMVAIMGPSGCGKSTLLNIIAGLDTPDEGELLLANNSITTLSSCKMSRLRNEDIGIVFQKYNLIEALTCYENICAPMALADKSIPRDYQYAKELLDAVDMLDKRNKYPSQLSGGEQQRIAIARALIMRPKLLLADEPTGALDEQSGMQMLQLLQHCNKQYHVAMIIVTHNEDIANQCHRTLHMRDGKI